MYLTTEYRVKPLSYLPILVFNVTTALIVISQYVFNRVRHLLCTLIFVFLSHYIIHIYTLLSEQSETSCQSYLCSSLQSLYLTKSYTEWDIFPLHISLLSCLSTDDSFVVDYIYLLVFNKARSD